jgi:hypothetical protein
MEREFYEEALNEAQELLADSRKLPADLVSGIATLMEQYREQAAGQSTTQGERSAVDYVRAIEDLLPKEPSVAERKG